ncbi:protein SCAF11 isoform X2 [Corythoichthys intestinalis]|uniref:protein SCAF11 isoform X2 n=1 Tax=Corythoichthys intestinalis TaxID=161448 RepID=UPI0025A63CB1|nr:protein SCAF11 isoform X2 [Corythoichthys intestinalis]
MTGAESGGQGPPPDGSDAEEAERCPICLGVPAGGELAMPESCCHVFCLGCLLTWAELQIVPSCPVDRRPFRNVYRWDRSMRCVQVPVRRRVVEPEAENFACRDPKNIASLKSKFRKRSRQQRAEKMADSMTKGLVRKCNDDESSPANYKKVRGTDCCDWPSSPLLSSATSTQDIQPVLLSKDVLYEMKECKVQVQECPWFSPVAPITANGTSRFVPLNDHHGPFTFGLCSSPITSTSSFGPDHFVFQGVVCAITCPKGGEKRGGRASNSKAPTKKSKSLPSRRSGRNSKSQGEPHASDPSSPQSAALDSDPSAGQASKPAGQTSPVPVKRKGKRVTNRKASGKRKNTRKKQSSELVESPSASDDEEGDEVDNADEGEKKGETNSEVNNSDQASDTEGSPNAEQNDVNSPDGQKGAESLNSNVEHDTNDTLLEKDSDERPEPDENSQLSCPLDSPPKSPESECPDDKTITQEEDPPVSSISTGDEKISTSPPSELENTLDDLISECENVTEQNDKMETCEEFSEQHSDEVSQDVPTESHESPERASPCPEPSKEKVADQEAKASEESKTSETQAPSLGDDSEDVVKDDDLSKDDTSVVPMDCSSPVSEANSGNILECVPSAAAETPPSVTDERSKDRGERDPSHERKNGRQRRSRFHSPTSSWSPKRDSRREPCRRSRSRSRERAGSPPSSRSSRARSREREHERDSARRERSRERKRRRSRSRSRSKSRSPSRMRSHRRGYSPERPLSRDHSPRRGGRRAMQGGANAFEGRRYHGGAGRFENGVPTETSPEHQGWSENPDWVTENTRGEAECRNWDVGAGSRWEDRGPRGRGGYERGRGTGRGGGNRGFHNQQDDDNRRPPRNSNSYSGNDAYSRFNENRGGGRRKQDSDGGDSMMDRSGWSSASSWAVRRTLPADVQDYYSKRERGGAGGWNRSEEEQPAADAAKSEPAPATVPGNAPASVLTAMLPPPPPQLNVLHHHFPMQGPRAPMPAGLQPAAPYAMPPPIPVHLHPAVPLMQMPAVGPQGLPPPPPPPPPMQQASQTAAAQPDGQITQIASNTAAFGKAGLPPTPTKISQQAVNQAMPSSTTPVQHHKAQADSSKKEKKQQIQEKAINEVKNAIKPYYQKKEITKEEYKEIVRKAVEKVCLSKSGEVNSSKVANLVKAYVDKYKHVRKK